MFDLQQLCVARLFRPSFEWQGHLSQQQAMSMYVGQKPQPQSGED